MFFLFFLSVNLRLSGAEAPHLCARQVFWGEKTRIGVTRAPAMVSANIGTIRRPAMPGGPAAGGR